MLAFMVDLAQIGATAGLALAVWRLTDVLQRLAAPAEEAPRVVLGEENGEMPQDTTDRSRPPIGR